MGALHFTLKVVGKNTKLFFSALKRLSSCCVGSLPSKCVSWSISLTRKTFSALKSQCCVFPVEPQRPNGKNIDLHKKWGFRRFQKECQKMREKCGEPHFSRIFCTLFAQKARFSGLFGHFLALFLESAETPLFVQTNVFAVWPLRLDRKYTKPVGILSSLNLHPSWKAKTENSSLTSEDCPGFPYKFVRGKTLVSTN